MLYVHKIYISRKKLIAEFYTPINIKIKEERNEREMKKRVTLKIFTMPFLFNQLVSKVLDISN